MTMASKKGLEAAFPSIAAPSKSHQNKPKASNVRVVARIRPMSDAEVEAGCAAVIQPLMTKGNRLSARSPARRVIGMSSAKRGELSHRSGPLAFLTPERKKKAGAQATPPRSRTGTKSSTPVTRNGKTPYREGQSTSEYGTAQSLQAQQKQFDFDAVFAVEATQKEVYHRSVGDSVSRNIFRGYNTTILAYGQTGSGKTFTMGGRREAELDKVADLSPTCRDSVIRKMTFEGYSSAKEAITLNEDDGIIPRAVHDLFKAKQLQESTGQVSIQLTYLEIYNDELRDLMSEGGDSPSSLRLRDQGDDGIVVNGLTTVAVTSVEHVQLLMHQAASRRITASTRMNMRSSRSHAICTLHVEVNPSAKAPSSLRGSQAEIVRAKLTLVDLAGSERIKDTGVIGLQQQESININKDLFVLAKVVSALAEKNKKHKRGKSVHVPYRDSKLTRLLRDSLGGNCCTVMVACISPASGNLEESVNTLRYAERTRSITNSIKPNVENAAMTPAECVAMRGENKQLKIKVLELLNRLRKVEIGTENDDCSLSHAPSFTEDDISLAGSVDSLKHRQTMLEHLDGLISKQNRVVARLREETKSLKSSINRSSKNGAKNSRSDVEAMAKRIEVLKNSMDKAEAEAIQRKRQLAQEIDNQEARLEELRAETSRGISIAGATRGLLGRMQPGRKGSDVELVPIKKGGGGDKKDSEGDRIKELERQLFETASKNKTLANELMEMKEQLSMTSTLSSQLAKEKQARCKGELEAKTISHQLSRVVNERDSLRVTVAVNQDTIRRLGLELEQLMDDGKENHGMRPVESPSNKKPLQILSSSQELLVDHTNTIPVFEEPVPKQHQTVGGASLESKPVASFDDSTIETENELSEDGDHKAIRVQAEKMLSWANKAIAKGHDHRSTCSSLASSRATDFLPKFSELAPRATEPRNVASVRMGKPPLATTKDSTGDIPQLVISNIDQMKKLGDSGCTCQGALFGGNADHADFYLPKLGLTCSCGKRTLENEKFLKAGDPLALENILRTWQVDFLKSIDIRTADVLVREHNKLGDHLGKEMRKWRRKQKLLSVKTKSCCIALHIWSRTCKSVVRSVGEQQAAGAKVLQKPAFLEVSIPSDRTVSTLGCGSFIEATDHVEM